PARGRLGLRPVRADQHNRRLHLESPSQARSGRRAPAPPHQARGGVCAESIRVTWIRGRRLPLFERLPVRWRLAATTAGLTLFILVVFALVLGQVVGDRIRSDFREELHGAARSLAAETTVQTDSVLGKVVDSPPLRAFALPQDAVIAVLDQYGHPL